MIHGGPRATPLSAAVRADALDAMRADGPLDVLIVGGGVVGAGAALDAATRGLRVGIVEARDWASGTSSRSSRLLHGGLRYLEMLEFGLVAEALRERDLIVGRLAPHLARPVPFLYPLTHRGWERAYVGAGMALYDVMGRMRGHGAARVPLHRHLSRRGALGRAPGLRADALVGAIEYHDAQIDDARYTLALVRTAVQHGALAASRAEVVGLVRKGDRVVGARVRDLESNTPIEVSARAVIAATGVWTSDLRRFGASMPQAVRASKGVHLVVPGDCIQSSSALILRTPTSVLFVLPWDGNWIVGTTDTDWSLDPAHPAPSRRDIDYLLEQANRVLERPLRRDDLLGVYAGLRPLVHGSAASTARTSRRHLVARPAPGLVAVVGGKYTTYRVMARDAVDAAAGDLSGPAAPCVTDRVPLVGAEGFTVATNRRLRLAEAVGLDVAHVDRLLGRHGGLVGEVVEQLTERPELDRALSGADGPLAIEVAYAASHEDARHLDDVLVRRTRIAVATSDRGMSAAPAAARIMGDVLGWDSRRRSEEVEAYGRLVRAQLAAEEQLDDAAASAKLVGVSPAARAELLAE